MKRTRILVPLAGALALSWVVLAGGGSGVTRAAPSPPVPVTPVETSPSGAEFVETFDLDESAPVDLADTTFADRWHVTQIVTDYHQWKDGDALDAQHGPDCGPPPATHRADTWDEYVYVCKEHLMTARAAPSYAATYLMPLFEVDLTSDEAVISWAVSTQSMSSRDWIDMWVTPLDDALMVPIEHLGPTLQGTPRHAVHLRNGNGSEKWAIQVIRDFETIAAAEVYLPPDFELSPKTRTPITLRVRPDEVELTMEGVGTATVAAGPGFDRGLVQWAQHSYNPAKDNSGVPATWHWDDFTIDPAVPLGVNRVTPVRSIGAPGDVHEQTFERAAEDGDQLLFDAVCQVEIDFGSGFEAVDKQPASKGNSVVEAQSSYRVPVPVGATGARVRFQGDAWYDGWPCVAENPIIVNSLEGGSSDGLREPGVDGDRAPEPAVCRPSCR